jgi:hypothetical protein
MPEMPDDPHFLDVLGKLAAAACVAIFIYGAALGFALFVRFLLAA